MIDESVIRQQLHYFGAPLLDELVQYAEPIQVPAGVEVMRQGQFVRHIPIVQSGLLKVFTRHDDKELLLYYIQPVESCVMSFAAVLKEESSRIFAFTEKPTTLLLLPRERVLDWINEYPSFNRLFYQQYDIRYTELIDTINELVFERLDVRLVNYLRERARLEGTHRLTLSHRIIANDLGSAREVISRTLKRLEQEGVITQQDGVIEVHT